MMGAVEQKLPLDPGMRLSREEFLRRWDQLPDLKRAELIDGIVSMSSPVADSHSRFVMVLGSWVYRYEEATPGCWSGTGGTWFMLDSVSQPDVHLILRQEAGGQSGIDDKYRTGSPELAIEVSNATLRYDTGPKLALYQRAGVREYLICSPERREILWRYLEQGRYVLLEPDAAGVLRSRVFPGLWLDSKALFENDRLALRTTIEKGIASPEHAAFVQLLQACMSRSLPEE